MSAKTAAIYGALEAGGTKVVCAAGTGPGALCAERVITTRDPDETLDDVAAFFRTVQQAHGPLGGIGIGCFGPLDLDPASRTFGALTSTPKPGWADTDVPGRLSRELGVACRIDTDVACAGLGEMRWGAGRGCASLAYVTVGTGIGGAILREGRALTGLLHSEMGHIVPPRAPGDEAFAGVCPYHGDCLEGLASGPALAARWGAPFEDLAPDHPAIAMEAHYIAHLCLTLIAMVSPHRIILGGGVMKKPGLIETVRTRLGGLLGGYFVHPVLERGLDTCIVAPELGDRAGVLGALALVLPEADQAASST